MDSGYTIEWEEFVENDREYSQCQSLTFEDAQRFEQLIQKMFKGKYEVNLRVLKPRVEA
jgi:hypothetical protein